MFKKVIVAEDFDSINLGIIQVLQDLNISHFEHSKYCDEAFLKISGYSAVKVATIPLQSAPGFRSKVHHSFRCKVHHSFRCKVHHLFRCKGYHLFRSKVYHFSPDLILVKD